MGGAKKYRIPNLAPETRYEEIMAAVYDAIDGALRDGNGELSPDTEKRLDLVQRMVRESLGLPQLD